MSNMDKDKPSCIPLICWDDAPSLAWLEKISNGIEEEGLFGESHIVLSEIDFEEELWKYCVTSRFSVAIGIKKDEVVFITKSVGREKPIFHRTGVSLTEDSARKLGGNAARYIKCKPFL